MLLHSHLRPSLSCCTSMMRISCYTTSQSCSAGLRSDGCGGPLRTPLWWSRNQLEMIWALSSEPVLPILLWTDLHPHNCFSLNSFSFWKPWRWLWVKIQVGSEPLRSACLAPTTRLCSKCLKCPFWPILMLVWTWAGCLKLIYRPEDLLWCLFEQPIERADLIKRLISVHLLQSHQISKNILNKKLG